MRFKNEGLSLAEIRNRVPFLRDCSHTKLPQNTVFPVFKYGNCLIHFSAIISDNVEWNSGREIPRFLVKPFARKKLTFRSVRPIEY